MPLATEGHVERRGVLGEFFQFLRRNKKWWLLPIIVVIFVLHILVLIRGPAVAPFIYTLF
ncbi:MAG: hypothetical protein E2O71_05495 [Deltaproteobacteria bacterium]|nr:MAG: hypothetical protein E2O71_05495 [Deltaproteobacteria bacterium]